MDAINDIIMLHHHSICVFFISLKAFFLFISLTQTENELWQLMKVKKEGKEKRTKREERPDTCRNCQYFVSKDDDGDAMFEI